MNNTTSTVKRRFAKRLRVLSSADGLETEALMLSKRKKMSAAATIASGSPNLRVSPGVANVRALSWRISEM